MTEIFLIRHTQAEGNVYRMMQGLWDGGVTGEGRIQQAALRERFENIAVDKVYSSDLKRAVFTARALSEPKGLEVIKEKGLREIDIGSWEKVYFGNVCHDEPEIARDFIYNCETWSVDGAETYNDVRERMYECMERIARENEGKRIAAVSHGVAIRCFTSKVTGISLNDTVKLPIFRNTSVSSFTYDKGVFTPVELNSYYHIENLGMPVFNRTADLRHEYIDPGEHSGYYENCYADSWLAAHGSLENFSPIPYLNSAKAHFAADPKSIVKLYDGDEAVGLVDMDTLRGEDEGVGWISLLYLRGSHRGKGYGIQALARPIMYYRELGRSRLRLSVAEENLNALKFYRRYGFKEIKKSSGYLLLMEKDLNEF